MPNFCECDLTIEGNGCYKVERGKVIADMSGDYYGNRGG